MPLLLERTKIELSFLNADFKKIRKRTIVYWVQSIHFYYENKDKLDCFGDNSLNSFHMPLHLAHCNTSLDI